MKLIRTAKIKANILVDDILSTMQAYTNAFNFVCQVGFPEENYNRNSLHNETYYALRKNLPSQLSISAINKASETLSGVFARKGKKPERAPQSKLCSIRYDRNSYSLFLNKAVVSILTISGRKRFPLVISDYHKEYFSSWKYKSMDLCIDKVSKTIYLHIVFEKDIEDTKSNGNLLGLDRGINNIVVSSDNTFYGSKKLKNLVNKQRRLRRKLQKCGSKSAKRHLRKLRLREQRFRADINHCISKEIISKLNPGDTIVLEDLTGIRNKRLRKEQRIMINSWSFFQLEMFLKYKAEAKGINVYYIDARFTSQRCSKCGFKCRSNRKTQSDFRCKQCSYKLNADLNASRNICIKALESYTLSKGVEVNQPNVSLG